jgi:riboflavin synthase
MFTGIVTDIGAVRAVRDTNRDRRFEIETHYDVSTIEIGASISHSGCCLTVIEKGDTWFAVEVSGETLAMSTLDEWREGRAVNLERAARAGDELGGHIVSGHVDGVGEVLSVEPEGGSHRVTVRVPRPLHRYIAPKGSISIEGVSLTVNEVADDVFGVNIIPHTFEVTTLGSLKPGSRVNLEIDMLARYLARWQETAP